MKGTEKQIKWAEDIQNRLIAGMKKFGTTDQFDNWLRETKTDAAWWIENKDRYPVEFLRMMVPEFKASL